MELRLEFMTAVCSDCVDPKRELLDHVVDKRNGVPLGVPALDLEGSDPGGIVNRRILKATNAMTIRSLQAHNLHVGLNMMPRDLLRLSVRMDSSAARLAWGVSLATAYERPIQGCTRPLDAVVAFQVPRNPLRTEAVGLPELQYPLDGLL